MKRLAEVQVAPLRKGEEEEELFSISFARARAHVHAHVYASILADIGSKVSETLIFDLLIPRIPDEARQRIENSRLRRLKHCRELSVNASDLANVTFIFTEIG